MGLKVAINGFGRIGRLTYRLLMNHPTIEVVAINDLADPTTLAHLLEFDSIHGKLNATIKASSDSILVNDKEVKVFSEKDITKIPWSTLNIDVVIESTGRFTNGAKAIAHIDYGGAKKVLITAPATNEDLTLVMGVNEEMYNPKEHDLISNGSCTTNGLAPVLKVLEENFGVESSFMNTVHGYTNDQRLLDAPHTDLRRARSAATNIIPTTTGAAKAIYKAIPNVEGVIDGIALRVPVADISIVDVVAVLKKETTVEELNNTFKKYANGELKGILACENRPLVSGDYIGNTHSSIVDTSFTQVVGKNHVRIMAWYDNEIGFASRLVDQLEFYIKKGL